MMHIRLYREGGQYVESVDIKNREKKKKKKKRKRKRKKIKYIYNSR
jgi:hypothetical protein